MRDKINYKAKRYYANAGTEENPEWEWLNNPLNDVQIFETEAGAHRPYAQSPLPYPLRDKIGKGKEIFQEITTS